MQIVSPLRPVFLAAAALLAGELVPTSNAQAAGQAAPRHVTLLHIADTHAQLETHPEYLPGEKPEFQQMGGYARIRTAADEARKSAPGAVFFVDGGDTFQGSAPAAWSQGEAVVGPLNALGLDVCVPGNWEPVYGATQFRKLMSELSCKVVAYNFHDAKTGKRLFDPATVIDRDGVRVAFVGITDPTTTERQPPDEVRGLDSTRMGGLREYVQQLRKEQKPDLVVAVDHTGLTISRELAKEIPEFDVILSGHTHERTTKPILEGKVIVVEPGSMGSFMGRLDLTLAPGGGVAGESFQLVPIKASQYAEDPKVKAEVDQSVAPYRARMSKVVGRTRTPLLRYDVLETTADDFLADAVKEAAGTDLGTANGFRFTPPILAGPITEGDLWSLLPLDARMRKGWITGKQLRDYLERELELVFSKDPWKLSGGWGPRISGLKIRFAAFAPAGHRLRSVLFHGRELRDTDRLSIAGCERAGEKPDVVCRLAGVHNPQVLPGTIHEALDKYFGRHPVIAPRIDERAAAIDLPRRVFSQDAILTNARSTK